MRYCRFHRISVFNKTLEGNVKRRKLQIFLSSTYEDLIDHRLTAMEAVLASGHIPATMEQFSPGDETAWEKIQRWIDESDAFILILGGRYGSLEPLSRKSYMHLEYEYALIKGKPFFSLVISDKHLEERVREIGLLADERTNPEKYKQFRELVTLKLCGFWNDKKDIRSTIFQKVPEWVQREDLKGWIRAEDALSAESANELARLSMENRKLREKQKVFEGRTENIIDDMIEEIMTGPGAIVQKTEQLSFLMVRAAYLRRQLETAASEEQSALRNQLARNLQKQLQVSPYQPTDQRAVDLHHDVIKQLEQLRDLSKSRKV
jgi:hypothetical protein